MVVQVAESNTEARGIAVGVFRSSESISRQSLSTMAAGAACRAATESIHTGGAITFYSTSADERYMYARNAR